MTVDFWNTRYQEDDYAYGKEPNAFFREQLDLLPKGKLLMPAEGEGRNAVYASTKSWEVYAFDSSIEAKKKAKNLAERNYVKVQYSVCDIENFDPGYLRFDAIGLIFVHLPEEKRRKFHKFLIDYLNPGGTIILEAFSSEQIGNPSGGPQVAELLYTVDQLKDDFSALETVLLEDVATELNEGLYHVGPANLVRYVGRKPE